MPSKKSSAVSLACWPIFLIGWPREKPGRLVSTRKSETPRAPASGSVLAQTITRSATWPLVMKILPPSSRQPPSVRRARLFMAARSLPAPGSVMAMAPSTSPLAMAGSQRCCCSGVAICSR